jgi:two-component system, NarL family, response regulator DegU
MNNKLRVYIADDHTLFRKAMVNLLQTFKRVSEVKDAENGKELLTLMKYDIPDVAIVDLQMPVMDGSETCQNIIQKYPDVKLIILTMHDSEKFILHMMEMGAHAFLLKNTEPDELERAIYAVVEKDFYHNDLVASVLRKDIVGLLCQELTNKEIGDRLGLSERTVENHRYRILEKLNLKSTIGLVRYAYDSGIIK